MTDFAKITEITGSREVTGSNLQNTFYEYGKRGALHNFKLSAKKIVEAPLAKKSPVRIYDKSLKDDLLKEVSWGKRRIKLE